MLHNEQMDFGMDRPHTRGAISQRERRLKRAKWWFRQMRLTVRRAVDWQPSPPARPEQVYFPRTE